MSEDPGSLSYEITNMGDLSISQLISLQVTRPGSINTCSRRDRVNKLIVDNYSVVSPV